MPKDEQNYWRKQKGNKGAQSKANGAAAGEDSDELRKEIENLRKKIKHLEEAPVQMAPPATE